MKLFRAHHRFDDTSINAGALAWLKARYEHDVNLLEHSLADGRAWIAETDHPSIADFSLCGYLYFADEAHVEVPARVTSWLERLASQPGWAHPYELMQGT